MLLVKKTLRFLLIGLLIFYFGAVTAMLGVRYLVLPHINTWRPQIEKRLSDALGAQVTMGEIAASWSGLNPSVALENLRLRDRKTNLELLYVPDAFAVISWRSVFVLDIRLRQLEINGVYLSGSRRADGNIVLAGSILEVQAEEKLKLSTDTPALRWLLNQGQIVVRNATFLWDDQFRAAPTLAIEGIDLNITNSIFRHQLKISGSLPPALGGTMELIVRTGSLLNPTASHEQGDAEIFVEMNDVSPGAWQPWMDIPNIQGRFAARMWLVVASGHVTQTEIDLAAANAVLPLGVNDPTLIHAEKLKLRLSGWVGDVLPDNEWLIFDRSPKRQGVSLTMTGQGVQLDSSLFEPRNLLVGQITADTQWHRNAQQKLQLNTTRLNLQSSALNAELSGLWTQGEDTSPGVVDITGTIQHADTTKLHQYVSTAVGDETRRWLRSAIRGGELTQIQVTLQGDLLNFPFNAPGKEAGIFRLEGQLNNLIVDYDFVEPLQPQWPALTVANGNILLNKLGLSIKSDAAHVMGMHGRPMQISAFEMNAPDLGLNPNIFIQLNSYGLAQDYVAVFNRTPVANLLGAELEALDIRGQASMPLAVDFNLDQQLAVKVQGQLKLSDVSIALSKENVPVQKINGVLDFTDEVFIVKALSGEALGGPVSLAGEWGPNKKHLTLQGDLTTVATEKHQKLSALLAVTGRTRYFADVKGSASGEVEIEVKSSLEGLTIKLPAPLGKTAAQKRPLSVLFKNTNDGKTDRTVLTFTLANLLNGRFERASTGKSQSYFSRGAIAMGERVVMPASGLSVNLGFDRVNWDDWKTLTDQLTNTAQPSPPAFKTTLFPDLTQLRVRSPEFIFAELSLHQLDLMLSRTSAQKWSARLESKETQGVANWTNSAKGIVGPVVAKFSTLSVGSSEVTAGEPPKTELIDEKQWSSIPAIDLTVDDFTLYGSRLGTLYLAGENTDNGLRWNINALTVTNPHAKMTAKGVWLLKGPERGVSLDGTVNISNLGSLSDQLGHENRAAEGSGTITAKINWTNFPWVYTYKGLNGQVNVDLKDGVFQHVNSRSARLLEVLSLQSLQRILSFNFRANDEFKNGFPWNSIRGDFSIVQGNVTTNDLVVRSPIARIALTGGSDLNQKVWNMHADVRPILDMSGAAVATAFVVNPIAGLSALVTQYILRHPLERVMSAKYEVKGTWDEPELIPIGVPTPVQPQNEIGG